MSVSASFCSGRDSTIDVSIDFRTNAQTGAAAFERFVREHCPGYSLTQAMQKVETGCMVVSFLLTASEQSLAEVTPQERAAMMAPFHWYLMFLSIHQEKDYFHEGMIVFKDPGHRIKNFFKGAQGIYRRWSSHFCERVPSSFQYCRFLGFNTNALDVNLSAKKKTVIFSELEMLDRQGEWTMIKAEDDPVSFRSPLCTVKHTWKWITRSILPRWIPTLFGNHYRDGFREELTPPEMMKSFKALVNEMIPNPRRWFPFCCVIAANPTLLAKKKKVLREVDQFGVSAMFKALSDAEFITTPFASRARQFKANLVQHVPNHLHLATGREVVLPNLVFYNR